MKAYEDPDHEGNSAKYRSGKSCVECGSLEAGTKWSPHFCFRCNVERINRINSNLAIIAKRLGISDE